MPSVSPATLDPDVAALLSELEALGATVVRGTPPSKRDLAAAEDRLGFSLPAEYKEFLALVGGLRVELERTWLFYGLDDALEKTDAYELEFEQGRAFADAYYPERFIVLMDEGDFANAGSGTIYDADLDAMLITDGHNGADKDEAFASGYWGTLLDALSDVRDRLADPDDILVAGSARDEARRQPAPRSAAFEAALDGLYAAFARRARVTESLGTTPLRELTRKDLEVLAYNGAPDYLHFAPRILDLLDPISRYGNPVVVIGQIWKNLNAADPTAAERAAIDRYVDALWEWLLTSPPVMDDLNESPLNYLVAFVRHGRPIEPFLATWTRLAKSTPAATQHAAKKLRYFNFDYTAADCGWHDLDAPFAALKTWLRALSATL